MSADDVETKVECPRCAKFGPSDVCSVCHGTRMCSVRAKNEWQEEHLKASGSGEYALRVPT